MNDPHLPTDTEIVISRILHAPRELVWEAWTNPKHVVNWWGPRGFTNTMKRHEFRVGGYWEHMMHGPDGTNYPNKAKFLEIVTSERITFLLGGGSDLEDDERRGTTFRATWTFETVDGDKTRLTGRMVFPSKEARDRVVRDYGAIEGGKGTLERAAEYVAGLRCEPFVVSRDFDAPLDLMWRAWTDPVHFARWWGPKGVQTRIAKSELKRGGMTLISMPMPGGEEMWVKAVYREITPPTKLVWVTSFSDKDGGDTTHPMWPRERLTVVTLAENAGKTTVTVTWVPLDATAAELAAFNVNRAGMNSGWAGTFEKLATHLAELQPKPVAKPGEFVITRTFDAPRSLVWRAWTEAEHMMKWYGPKECTTTVAKMDFRPGGIFHYCMQTPDGAKMWGKAVYREIVAPERLVWINSFSDEAGGLTRHPGATEWPLEMLTLVTFAEQDGKTLVTLTWTTHLATAAEQKVFADNHPGMTQGWTGSFDRLAAYLAASR